MIDVAKQTIAIEEFTIDWPLAGGILKSFEALLKWNAREAERYRLEAYELIEGELRHERWDERERVREWKRKALREQRGWCRKAWFWIRN